MPDRQQLEQQQFELPCNAGILTGAHQELRRACHQLKLLQPPAQWWARKRYAVGKRWRRPSCLSGQGGGVDTQDKLLAIRRQRSAEPLPWRTENAVLAIHPNRSPQRVDLRFSGYTEHQQVIAIDCLDLDPHGVAKRDRPESQPADLDEIHTGAPSGTAVWYERMWLHDC